MASNAKAKYHYEYFCYTSNLNWGRMLLGRAPSANMARIIGMRANRGGFRIEKRKVIDETTNN